MLTCTFTSGERRSRGFVNQEESKRKMPEFGEYEYELELHASTHENGGADEIDVSGISGELADDQPTTWTKVSGKPSTFPPDDHDSMHEDGGAGEISVAGLAGVLADKQDADKLQGRDIHTTAPSDGQVYSWDAGNSRWEPSAAAGVTKHTDLTDKEVAGVIDHAALSVSTAKLAANAVTQIGHAVMDSDIGIDNDTWASTGLTVTITTTGGDVILLVRFNVLIGAFEGHVGFRVNRDSGTEYIVLGDVGTNDIVIGFTGSWAYFTSLSAASHTFTLEWRLRYGTGTARCYAALEPLVFNPAILALEIKK